MAVGTPGAIRQPPPGSEVLGQGIKYPMEVDSNGRLALSFGVACVAEAVESICVTQPGERVMEPDYGAAIGTFEPIDAARRAIAVKDQISAHEPRVDTVDVVFGVGQNGSEVVQEVRFTIIGDATPHVLTSPSFEGP